MHRLDYPAIVTFLVGCIKFFSCHPTHHLASNWSVQDDLFGVRIRAGCISPSLLQNNHLCASNLSSEIDECIPQFKWPCNSCPNTREFQCLRDLHDHWSCARHFNITISCTVPTVMQISPAYKSYGIRTRIV